MQRPMLSRVGGRGALLQFYFVYCKIENKINFGQSMDLFDDCGHDQQTRNKCSKYLKNAYVHILLIECSLCTKIAIQWFVVAVVCRFLNSCLVGMKFIFTVQFKELKVIFCLYYGTLRYLAFG